MNLTREKDRKFERAVGDIIAQRWYHRQGHRWPSYNLQIVTQEDKFRVMCMKFENAASAGTTMSIPMSLQDDVCELIQQAKRRLAAR